MLRSLDIAKHEDSVGDLRAEYNFSSVYFMRAALY